MALTNHQPDAPSPSAATSKVRKGFQEGVSGNPKGRPKGSRNKATLMAQALLDGLSMRRDVWAQHRVDPWKSAPGFSRAMREASPARAGAR